MTTHKNILIVHGVTGEVISWSRCNLLNESDLEYFIAISARLILGYDK